MPNKFNMFKNGPTSKRAWNETRKMFFTNVFIMVMKGKNVFFFSFKDGGNVM